MFHSFGKFPSWSDAPREEVSRTFAPGSPYTMVSLAKMFRGQDGVVGNDRPVVALRDRAGALPSKAAQVRGGIPRRLQHGRACSCCNPRQGRPRKPYRRSRGEE